MNEALILELLGEVRGLRAELARAHAGAAVPVACHALLAEIAAHVGERAFTSSELLQHADTANAWLDALADAGAATPRRAGKLFRKIAGRNLSGFVVERTGRESGGTVWAVRSRYRARTAGLVTARCTGARSPALSDQARSCRDRRHRSERQRENLLPC